MVGMLTLLGGGLYNSMTAEAKNPYLPQWEHIPDGEPYVFEDPENPGKYRLYIYGSHDTRKTGYCGVDLVTWSAPVEDLTDWRYEGVVFESIVNGTADKLYAPDIVEIENESGEKTYYFYPNNQSNGRKTMIAKSNSPVGPFEACNWKPGSSTETVGDLLYDPAAFVDDDGRAYGYWGVFQSFGAELDPDTMCTVKEGTDIITDLLPSYKQPGDFRFYEASSIRKIEDKYVLIYSRVTKAGEDGLGASESTLAYAYSDKPLGPWTYGGTIVDARAICQDENGKNIATMPKGNTHGSIVEVNGQWYVFYHRQTNKNEYCRQGMAEPIDVKVTEDGKVEISKAEVTSQGLEINGLNPYESHSAGLACWQTGGAYTKASYDKKVDGNNIAGIKNGSIVGYKYFNFDGEKQNDRFTELLLNVIPKGNAGTLEIMMDNPWPSTGGKKIGEISISEDESGETLKTAFVPELDNVNGKHAIYFVAKASHSREICELIDFRFGQTKVFLKEDFTGGLENWKVTAGNPEIKADDLHLENEVALQAKEGENWSNYRMDYEFMVSNGEFGIRFRQSDENNYYELKVRDGQLQLFKVVYGKKTVLNKKDCQISNTESKKISVNCWNDEILVRLDGNKIMSCKDDSHDEGTIGMVSYEGTSVAVSSVNVYDLNYGEKGVRVNKIYIDGMPLEGFAEDVFEYQYKLENKKFPVITAESDEKSVKISVSQATDDTRTAIVRFISKEKTETYRIHFMVGEHVTWGDKLPEGWTILNEDLNNGKVTFAGDKVIISTSDQDYPKCKNILQAPFDTSGDWVADVRVEMNREFDTKWAQFGLALRKDDSTVCKVDTEWENKANNVFYYKAQGNMDSPIKVASPQSYPKWLRMVKSGNTLEGFFSDDGETYKAIGKKTIAADMFDGAKLTLYATHFKGSSSFEATFSDFVINYTNSKTEIGEEQTLVEEAAVLIGNVITIPNSEYADEQEKLKAAQDRLDEMQELKEIGVECKVTVDEDGNVKAEISKNNVSMTVKSISIVVEKNWEQLQKLIEQVRGKSQYDYTVTSWKRVDRALNGAEALTEDSDIKDISVEYEKLEKALNALEKVEYVNKDILEGRVDALKKLKREYYTGRTWGIFEEALKKAQGVLDNDEATQKEVDAVLAELNRAADALERIYHVVAEGILDERYEYNTQVTVKAPIPEEGMKFVGWTTGEKVVSFSENYTFFVANDIMLKPVYVENSVTVETKAEVFLSNLIITKRPSDGKSDAKYVGQLILPEGYTLVNAGLVWSSNEDTELVIDGKLNQNAKVTYIKAISKTNQFSVTIKGMPGGRSMHGVVFATVRDRAGNEMLICSEDRRAEAYNQ